MSPQTTCEKGDIRLAIYSKYMQMTKEESSILNMHGDAQKVTISRSPYQMIERSVHVGRLGRNRSVMLEI